MRGSVTDRSNEAVMEGRAEARGRTEPCGHERKRTPERRVPQGHRLNGHTHERRAEGCAVKEKKSKHLTITDAAGHEITATYDLLGRRLTLESADGGRTEWAYDAYNLVSESTAAMREKSLVPTRYYYDGLNRLVRTDYPETADTLYEYGEPNAADNAAGRLVRVTDAGGTTAYRYGKLGEAAEETRTVRRRRNAGTETLTAATGYEVNYLGQIERIVYPDGETVSYGYDAGGTGGGDGWGIGTGSCTSGGESESG